VQAQWSAQPPPQTQQEDYPESLCSLQDWFTAEFLQDGYNDLPLFDLPNTLDTSTSPNYNNNDASMMQSLDDLVDSGNCYSHHSQDDWNQPSGSSLATLNNNNGLSTSSPDISPPYSDASLMRTISVQQSPAFSEGAMFPPLNGVNNVRQSSSKTTSDSAGHRSIGSPSSSADSPDGSHRVKKRQKNTEAARRYRQRKVDKLSEVEDALREMTRERDELKLKLARSQSEADVLRSMVKQT